MRTRTMRIDSVDESGFFQMTLATEGEASDGDILSMKGGQIPERMPLLLSHYNDPTAIAGSITDPRKELKHSPPRLRTRGQIEMEGEGALAEIRRDVAMMTNKHGGAVSIRWDESDGGDPPIRRVNLPSDHPYFVDAEKEKSWRKRNGYFWPSWKALEGSIVALGSDSDATIGGRLYAQRADETEGEVSKFWRAMADDARHGSGGLLGTPEERQYVEDRLAATPKLEPVGTDATTRKELASVGLDNLNRSAFQLREANAVTATDLINAVTLESDGQDFEPITIGDEQVFLPQRLAEQLDVERKERAETPAQKKLEPDPEPAPARVDQPSSLNLDVSDITPPIDVDAFGRLLEQSLDKFDERMIQNVQAIFDLHTGKV